jgi:membrane protease YdiL (CAAX protease family)
MNVIYYFVRGHIRSQNDIVAVSAELFAADIVLILVAMLIIGNGTWRDVRRSIRLPAFDTIASAIACAVSIAVFLSVGQLIIRILVPLVYQSANIQPLAISHYFVIPKASLFIVLFIAFGEEVIYRGILQPRFIQRYGLVRGIALLGIVFAVWHLDADFSGGLGLTDWLGIAKLSLRLVSSISLGFVAGWFTLRSGSILPAALAHGLFNVFGFSALGPQFPGMGPLTYLLWALLGYWLFRRWPIRDRICCVEL